MFLGVSSSLEQGSADLAARVRSQEEVLAAYRQEPIDLQGGPSSVVLAFQKIVHPIQQRKCTLQGPVYRLACLRPL